MFVGCLLIYNLFGFTKKLKINLILPGGLDPPYLIEPRGHHTHSLPKSCSTQHVRWVLVLNFKFDTSEDEIFSSDETPHMKSLFP